MTEISDMREMAPAIRKFVLHWGEMGTKWGINRTVAQIHALLYVSDEPLNAEEICEALGVARSNVSNSLKELQNWGIVKVVHFAGDRRDHFESVADVYEMFRIILAERKKREIDPTLVMLRECVAEAEKGKAVRKEARGKLGELLGFFETLMKFYDQMNKLPTKTAVKAFRMGDKLVKLVKLVGK